MSLRHIEEKPLRLTMFTLAVVLGLNLSTSTMPPGGGNKKGALLSNNKTTKVSLLAPCQDNWCHVKGDPVPTGEGWVYSGTDPGDFQSLQF